MATFESGRFVLYEPGTGPDGTDGYVTSWDTWEDAGLAWPIPFGTRLRDDETGVCGILGLRTSGKRPRHEMALVETQAACDCACRDGHTV